MKGTAAGPDRFEGFVDADCRFFKALMKHQNRTWFLAHKSEYEDGWATPMTLLLTEVRERVDGFFPHIDLAEEPKLFRIHRDVRFAKDKSPYKTHVAGMIVVRRMGSKATEVPAVVYAQFGAEESFIGAGQYMMDPDQLARFRAAVLDDKQGAALAAMMKKLQRAGFEFGSAEVLKRVPRGFDPDHPRADLLRRKGFYVGFPEFPRKLLVSRSLVSWIVSRTKEVAPFVEWLAFVTA